MQSSVALCHNICLPISHAVFKFGYCYNCGNFPAVLCDVIVLGFSHTKICRLLKYVCPHGAYDYVIKFVGSFRWLIQIHLSTLCLLHIG